MLSMNGPNWFMLLGLLAAAALCGCLASWGLSHALGVGGRRSVGPAAALVDWAPTALCVLVAMLLGQPTLAVTLIYATSLAAVTVVLGGALLFTPDSKDTAGDITGDVGADAAGMRPAVAPSSMLSLGLPMAMMVWLIGFSGNVTPASAVALLIAALAAMDAWAHDAPDSAGGPIIARAAPGSSSFRLFEAAVALGLGLGGAWMAVAFTREAAYPLLRISPELLVVMPLAPVLLLPLFSRAAGHANRGRPTSAVALALGVVVLNVGVLLPITAVVRHLIPPVLAATGPSATTVPATTAAVVAVTGFNPHMSLLGIPLLLWRLDNMLLVLVALAMFGVRIGYYSPHRRMGMALLLLYAGYFMMSIVMRLA